MSSHSKSPRLAVGITAIAIAAACAALPAAAAELATATLTSTELSSTSWQYSLSLADVGTTSIGTFWFAWIPGQDYMPTSPTNIADPASWTAQITGGNAGNGYAIRWVAGPGAALAPGQSLAGFTFESSTTPQQMAADSPFYPGTPVLTSFAYSGAAFASPGVQFVAQAAPVPEPASLAMLSAGMVLLVARAARRRSPGIA